MVGFRTNIRISALTAIVALALIAIPGRSQEKLSIRPDPTFGKDGFQADLVDAKTRSSDMGRFLTLDNEGRPIVAGNSTGQRFAVARYTKDGRPDRSYGDNGRASICIEDPATVEAA